MKKIKLILLILFISISAFSQTVNFPGTMQRTVDGAGFKFKFVGGLGTFAITDSIRAAASGGGSAGVISFASRNGIVSPQSSDYDPFYPLLVGTYNNPTWINTLAYSKITGVPSFITNETDPVWSGVASTYRTKTQNDALYYPLGSNPSNYLTSVPAQSFASLTGKPTTLSGYGITDAYPLSGNPSNFITSSALIPYQLISNLSTNTGLGTSNTLYPSQNAVKTYVDNSSIKTVEFYRQSGMTDDEVIQAAINDLGKGANIILGKGINYSITNAILMDSLQILIGNNSTITRANATTSTLSIAAASSATAVTVSSVPSSWKIGDQLQFYTTSDGNKSSILLFKINNIVGNVITLSKPIGISVDGSITTWAIGTNVRKIYPLVTSKYTLDLVNAPFSVKNVIFKGNKAGNSQSYYWYANPVIACRGFQSIISNNYFYDSTNETIVMQGAHVENNYAYNINGSFVHISGQADVAIQPFEQENMWIQNNYTMNSNLISTTITTHSEGVITNSFNGGNGIISGNRFFNGGNGALGSLSTSTPPASIGIGKLVWSDNYVENCQSIIHSFAGGAGTYEGNISFSGGEFNNCGVNDWTSASDYGVSMQGVKLSGTTTITNSTSPLSIIDKDNYINLNRYARTTSPGSTFSFSATGNTSGNLVAMGTDAAGNPVIQGYNSAFNTPKKLLINPYSTVAGVWFGDAVNDGTSLPYQFNGGLGVRGLISQGTNVVGSTAGRVNNFAVYDDGTNKFGLGIHGSTGNLDISANQSGSAVGVRIYAGSVDSSPTLNTWFKGNGNVLIGSATDNGAMLQINGKATVLTAPTNSTDVVRKTELDTKQATLVSGTNIATINGNNLLVGGNIVISGGGGSYVDLTTNQTVDGLKLFKQDVLIDGSTGSGIKQFGFKDADLNTSFDGGFSFDGGYSYLRSGTNKQMVMASYWGSEIVGNTQGASPYSVAAATGVVTDHSLRVRQITTTAPIFEVKSASGNSSRILNLSSSSGTGDYMFVSSAGALNLPLLTASALLKLDASKNVVNAVSGTDFVTPSGNVATATALANSRNLWGVVFNGTANVTGKPVFTAGTTTTASINIPHGVAPTTPVNGDIWTTSAGGLFSRINGVTQNYLSSIPTIQQVLTSGSTATIGASFGADVSIGNTTSDNRLFIQPSTSILSINSATNSGSTSKALALNAPGGNVLVGTTTDNGERLQVNGKLTVSGAPTNPTDVVRLQDINTQNVITKTANYSIAVTDNVIVGETAGATFTFTLPSAASAINKKFTIMNYSGQTIAINTTGGANEIRRTTGNTNGVNLLASSLGATLSFFSNGTFYYQGF